MNRRKLVRIILCTLLIIGPLTVPVTLWFSNASMESMMTSFTNYNCASLILREYNTPIFSKDLILYGDYPNWDTGTNLAIELPGVPLVDSVNFTLSGIIAPNYTIQIAENLWGTESLENKIFAMSFEINDNQTCYLYSVSLFLIVLRNQPFSNIYVDFAIFNATWNSTHVVPDANVTEWADDYNLKDQEDEAWKTIDIIDPVVGFGDLVALDPINTDNGTFFVVLTQNRADSKYLYWAYSNDTTSGYDYGHAYDNTSGTPLLLDSDYFMRVDLSACNFTNHVQPFPTEINLKINEIQVQNSGSEGSGICVITGDFGSSNALVFDFDSTWFDEVSFNVTVEIYGTNLFANVLMSSLFQGYSLGSMFQTQDRNNTFLIIGAIGAVAVAGASGYRANRKRKIPLNAMRNMESIIVDHSPTGGLIWSFDFISMQQDIALVSGFMSAVKTFLKEMKIGGLKRLGTDFGTFIREESQLLTATCITGEIGIDEELWIRGKLHEFLIKIEQSYYKELQAWKGNVAQFRETFPMILGAKIDLDKVQKLQLKKIEKLSKNMDKMQKKVNKYGGKLEKQKAKYDSGEIDFKKYIVERYKTEAKFDKVQREYIYASLFLQRKPSPMEPKKVTPKATQEMEKIQKRFFEVRAEIEELERKEWQGVITSTDIERKERLQRELFALIEELGKFQEK
ncbi:MAG: hypothetical protein ACETWM_09150 [Candidatus Lokiarchaeia archaeon]